MDRQNAASCPWEGTWDCHLLGKAVSEAGEFGGSGVAKKQNPLMGWDEGPLGACFRRELPDHTCLGGWGRRCPVQVPRAAKANTNSTFLQVPGEGGAGQLPSLQDGGLSPGMSPQQHNCFAEATPEVERTRGICSRQQWLFPTASCLDWGKWVQTASVGWTGLQLRNHKATASPGPPGAVHVSYDSPHHSTYYVKATKSRNWVRKSWLFGELGFHRIAPHHQAQTSCFGLLPRHTPCIWATQPVSLYTSWCYNWPNPPFPAQ